MRKLLFGWLGILLFCSSAHGWQLIITSLDEPSNEKYILLILNYVSNCAFTQWHSAPENDDLEDYFNKMAPDILEKMRFKALRGIAPTFIKMTIKHDGYAYTLYHCAEQQGKAIHGRKTFEIML